MFVCGSHTLAHSPSLCHIGLSSCATTTTSVMWENFPFHVCCSFLKELPSFPFWRKTVLWSLLLNKHLNLPKVEATNSSWVEVDQDIGYSSYRAELRSHAEPRQRWGKSQLHKVRHRVQAVVVIWRVVLTVKQPSTKSINGVSLNVQWHQGVSIRLANRPIL